MLPNLCNLLQQLILRLRLNSEGAVRSRFLREKIRFMADDMEKKNQQTGQPGQGQQSGQPGQQSGQTGQNQPKKGNQGQDENEESDQNRDRPRRSA
jgi:hypothetical protein